ncbi:MAG: hypothetical protein ACTSQI_10810 [Candidatus Helarchaeota archaeon]
MSLRVIFDESHGELLSINTCRGIAYVIEKLKITPFRLISGPITIDKIANEDVLFLGAPTKKFFDFEINTLNHFVSKGKFLIIICAVPVTFNFTLNDLLQSFGMMFEHDLIQDKKHNIDGASYFPIIRRFYEDPITRDIKELAFSGCSIKSVGPGIKVLATTDEDAEPASVPVIATTQNGKVICIGGSSLFQDDRRTGIKAKNNLKFVANLFRAIIRRKSQEKKPIKITEPSRPKKVKALDPKKAKKLFEKLITTATQKLTKISDDIDTLFDNISQLIASNRFSTAEATLKTKYKEFKAIIEAIYQETMEKHEDLNNRITKEIAFSALVQDSTEQLLVAESEALSKLDMIRFNLANKISNEKLRTQSR